MNFLWAADTMLMQQLCVPGTTTFQALPWQRKQYFHMHESTFQCQTRLNHFMIILEKTCCVSFCLNSVAIRSLSIFCCFCTLVNLSLKYSLHFVFQLFARSRDLEMPGNISAVYVNITRSICQRAMSTETHDRLYIVIAFSVSVVRCLN